MISYDPLIWEIIIFVFFLSGGITEFLTQMEDIPLVHIAWITYLFCKNIANN